MEVGAWYGRHVARDDHRDRLPERTPSRTPSEELEERWAREVERRWLAIEAGEDTPIPWEEAEKFIFAPVTPRRPV
jgi:putative addiction module component (TIGR02574 family)